MPMVWGIAAFVGIVIGVYVLMGSGAEASKRGATMKPKFDFPTNDKHRLRPKVYGTRWITGPNQVDYGLYTSKAVYSDEVYED